ncbi:phosphatase PAP2 family protein [Propionispora vibrioides]|uniref:Undecaprenyl-diphosphatase n=1 Tax=Propionispora vibrioides TaxID=112903 RepID=A0A1H8XBD5_9FIRM|nr:phosphatase PAP2 family protein [Propionispora vibrioides]SEP37265.1 undecaprenyl-diphosphatase [Propionispora vibrioides]
MEWIVTLDQTILFWIQNHLVSSVLNPYMIFLSAIGNSGIIWIVLGIALLAVKKYRWLGVTVLLALVMSLVLGNGILKPLAARLRPCTVFPWMPLLISLPTDYSFPSGHTFASFAAAAAIFCRSRKLGATAFLLATGIGFSRLYLFVHYPSDVLAGVLLGTLSGVAAHRLSSHLSTVRSWHWQQVLPKSVIVVRKDEFNKQ